MLTRKAIAKICAPCRGRVRRGRGPHPQKAWLISSVMLIAFCAVGMSSGSAGHDVLSGRLTAGSFSAFVFYASVVASGPDGGRSLGASCSAPPAPPSG